MRKLLKHSIKILSKFLTFFPCLLSSAILFYLRSVFIINMIYLNILLLGMILCLGAPIFIDTLIGVNIYDQNSIYSMSLFQIRICCATVFCFLFFLSFDYLFFMLNKSKIRLKLSIFNKPIM